MPSTQVSYQTRPYSQWRSIMSDALRVAKEKNYIYGLYEIDVTEARRLIHEYKAHTGGDLSFTAFLIACIAQAVDENKSVQAYKQGNRLIIFDDVDVSVQVEHEVAGERVVSAHIVRAANGKTARQIHDEIRAAQREQVTPEAPVNSIPRWAQLAGSLPSLFRRVMLRRILDNPFLIRQVGGTVDLTAIGMAGKGGGWGISIAETPLLVTVGGVDQKVKLIDGEIQAREMLSMTLGFDHDVIDGAPATRFATRLKELIETAHGLEALGAVPATGAPESALD